MRRIWRVCKWGLIVLVCLAAGVLLLNAFDDSLDPGAKALLDAPIEQVPRQQNLYYAALGFGTTGDDPEQAGWDQAQKAEVQLRAGVDSYSLMQEDGRRLQFSGDLTHLPVLGDFKGALDFARQHADETAQLLANNRLFIDRYQSLYAYKRYVDPIPAAAGSLAIMPNWSLISYGKRLQTLELARDLSRNGSGALVAWLQNDNHFWRQMVSEEGTGLIGKMIMAAQLRADFLIASQLIHLVPLESAQLEAVREVGAMLSEKERSLKGVWKSEFQWSVGMLSRATDEKPLTGKEVSWRERLNFRFQKLFYLPNATINRRYRYTLKFDEMDGHSCSQYAADRAGIIDIGSFTSAPWTLIRNPVGSILVDISGPAYVDYPSRMCDLQGFQRLLGLQVLLHQRNAADADIPTLIKAAGREYTDPYTGAPMQWLSEQRALTFGAHGKRENEFLPRPI